MPDKDRYEISLKTFLHNDRGEVLILEAFKGGTYDGFYDLPGGRINTDEFRVSLTDILRREIAEETGLNDVEIDSAPVAVGRHLIPADKSSSGQEKHVLYLFFTSRTKFDQVKISFEHISFKWVDLAKIDLSKYLHSANLEGARMYLLRK